MEIQGVGQSMFNLETSQITLTEEQKSKREEILAKYDSENLSEEDWEALREELKEAGIPPCRDTFTMMQEAGIQPPPPPEGGKGPGPMPPPAEDEENSEVLELFEQLKSGEITKEDFYAQIEALLENGTVVSGAVVDTTV